MHPVIDKVVLFGPYIGDWKEEIVSFRPYVKWIYENVEFTDYYVSSHFNRSFLYDFMEDEKFIPVFESLTREETKQNNASHKDIKTKEYNSIILRKTREEISERTKYLKKNIVNYGLPYVKSESNFSNLNKSFSQIPFERDEEKEKIVFIPDENGGPKILDSILNHLDSNYKKEYVVIGDKKCYFEDENSICERVDYFEMVYRLLVDYISNAKIVICPCSHWTILANQQGSFVLSWGNGNIAQYKRSGTYGFGNENSIVDINDDVIERKLLDHIDHNIEKAIY